MYPVQERTPEMLAHLSIGNRKRELGVIVTLVAGSLPQESARSSQILRAMGRTCRPTAAAEVVGGHIVATCPMAFEEVPKRYYNCRSGR